MKRTLIGIVFVLHGLAHSGLGMWAMPLGPDWFVVPMWWLAEVGFIVAGFGLLGIPWCRKIWEPVAVVAVASSILLLQRFGSVALAFGLVLDILILVHGLRWGESALLSFGRTAGSVRAPSPHPQRRRLAVVAATALVAYVALAIPLRSWYLRWGTTGADRAAVLPGDELTPVTSYRVDRAVTIRAPADSVWPWLVQMGGDRGGWYSWDYLDNGRRPSSDRIVPDCARALALGDDIAVRNPHGDVISECDPGSTCSSRSQATSRLARGC